MADKKPLSQSIKTFATLHGGDICLGVGIVAGVAALGLAIHGTVRAVREADKKKAELKTDRLAPKELFKTVWKCYIPTAIAEALSIGCAVKSGVINRKTIAAATVAYKVTNDALEDYKKAATKVVGERKEKVIQEKAAQEYLDRTPMNRPVISTGKGETRFIDSFCGIPFKSDINFVKKCVNDVNALMNEQSFASFNDWYEFLGLDATGAGYDNGWALDKTGLMDVYFDPGVWTDGEPCFVIKYRVRPINTYMR